MGDQAHLLTPPPLFPVDLAIFQSQNSPTQISDSHSDFCFPKVAK